VVLSMGETSTRLSVTSATLNLGFYFIGVSNNQLGTNPG
jgi:hypothetical protein